MNIRGNLINFQAKVSKFYFKYLLNEKKFFHFLYPLNAI